LFVAKELADRKTEEFTNHYRKYSSLVMTSVYSKVENLHEAEEICQEVFIRYFENFDEVKDPRKWLYGTLRNVVLDYYKTKKRNDVDIEKLFDDISMSFVNGFKETRLIIEEALNNFLDMNDTGRIIFELVAIYNYTYREAGKHLNLTYKQVRTRYYKTVDSLISYLKGKGIKSLEDLL
jgi:RNA polymerase sigma factor (sigma-70 family)